MIHEQTDLCSTCIHAPVCKHRDECKGRKTRCEEFLPVSLLKEKQREENPSKMGLCMNCKHRDYCAFPKPEGGVWHCEEYE